MQKTVVTILNAEGQPVLAGTVQVRDFYSGANVTIYADNETTTITNPVSSDAQGIASFKCNNGVYDLIVNNGVATKTINALKISDGAELHLLTNGEGATIPYGAVCYVNSSGNARLAKNNGTEAESRATFICITRGGLANGVKGVFSGIGRADELSGLTTGGSAWLGTAGGIITTALDPTNPSNVGKYRVYLGECLATTSLQFKPSEPIAI